MPTRATAAFCLEIDAAEAARRIEDFIRRQAAASGGRVILGASGGIDSALVATLAARALGPDAVHLVHLKGPDNSAAHERRVRLLAEWLGLEPDIRDIGPDLLARGDRPTFGGRLLARLGGRMLAVLFGAYRLAAGETQFVSGLRHGDFRGRNRAGLLYNPFFRRRKDAAAARHVYRREVLERIAAAEGALALGAGNRSETLVGYFGRGAIDDLPVSPILGLYKTQVWQLARHLGLPAELIEQAPAGGLPGLTDEIAMGIPYERTDLALDGMERGLSDEEMAARGLPLRDVSLVRQMHRLSAWRRTSEHLSPPADGGLSGGLRRDTSL